MHRKLLCKTLGGNNCEVLTITSNSLTVTNFFIDKRLKYRKGVVILARQHSGESQGSYAVQGIIDFLTSNSPDAESLRTNCVFKIIPMMNVDGVVLGNYRCGLEGHDPNRRWNKPNKVYKFLFDYILEVAPVSLLCEKIY